MAKKRKKYMVTVDSEAFACSLVTSPAVEETFVAFNEEKPLIEKFADEKKHMITGVVAIPQKPIYRRNNDGEEYDIVFSAEAIESMAKNFMKNYRQHEVTLQHQEDADGVYLVEQWIKTDPYRDKSAAIGLSEDLPVGSWIQTYYVDSIDIWQRIESGELQGFSLECMLGLEEFESQIELNKNSNNMNIETNEMFWDKLKNILKDTFSKKAESDVEPIDMEDLSSQSGFTSVEDYNREVNAINEELEENGTQEPAVEQITQEPQAAEEAEEGNGGENEPSSEGSGESESRLQDIAKLEELVGSLQHEIEALKTMNSGLEDKVKELSKEPSVKPVNTNAKPSGADSYSTWREQLRNMIG